ncbi:MAG: oligosaccharide flippase family protein [Sphingomonadales bacterium]
MVDKSSDRKDLGRGALAMLAGFVPRSIAGLSFLFLAGNLFGASNLGSFFVATATVEILGAFCVLGMKRSLYPFLEEAEADGADNQAISAITWSALALSLGLAVPLSIISFFALKAVMPDVATHYLAFALPLIVLADVLLAITRHRRVMVYYILSRSVLEPWAKALLCALFGFLGILKFGLIFAYLGGLSAAVGVALWGYVKLFGLQFTKPAKNTAAKIFTRSFPTMITDLLQMAARRADLILIGTLAGPALAGPYGVAKEITTNVQKTHELFAPVLAPITAQTLARFGGKSAGQQLAQVNRWIFTLQVVQWLFFVPTAAAFLSWAGDGFEALGPTLLILLGAEVIIATTLSAELPLVFARPWIATLITSVGIAIQLSLCAILIPSYGALGAAYGVLASALVLAALRLLSARVLTGAECINGAMFKPLIAGGCGLSLILLAQPYLVDFHPALLISTSVILALLPFSLLIYMLGISPEDRGLLSDLMGK